MGQANKGKVGAVCLAAILLGGAFCTFKCTERIPAGYVGVVYNMSGGVDGEVLTQGFHLVAPTKKVTKYSVAIEQAYMSRDEMEGSKGDDSFDIPTSDGKTINVDLEFSYHFNPDMVAQTFTQFKGQSGKNIENSFIKGKMKAWAGEVSATYTVIDVFGDKRAELNNAMKNYIADKFAEYGIVIDTVNFTRVETDSETAGAIQKKVNAQQELELSQIEAKTAKVQAEKNKEVALIAAEQQKEAAEIEAQKAAIKAQGEADALRISAQAEADANQKIAESLTPELVEKIKYDAWDGKLPTVQSDGSAIIDLR